jgi:pimeloyl-[acyl-carrier protein] methyl ester esterase
VSLSVIKIGSGPDLVLLHGWGLNLAVWDSVVADLATRYTLTLIDLPGHGLSADWNASHIEEAANAVAAVTPPHSAVLGWSLGGQFAIQLATHYTNKVSALILVATTPKFVTSDDWPHGVKADVLNDFVKRLSTSYAATIRHFLALQVLHSNVTRSTITALQKAIVSRGEPNITNLMHGLTLLAASDYRHTLSAIVQPTLVIQGDHDALTREPAAAWMAARIPNATYLKIAHAAHAPFLSHREQFLEALNNFLSLQYAEATQSS